MNAQEGKGITRFNAGAEPSRAFGRHYPLHLRYDLARVLPESRSSFPPTTTAMCPYHQIFGFWI